MTNNKDTQHGLLYRLLLFPGTDLEGWPALMIHIGLISALIGVIFAPVTGKNMVDMLVVPFITVVIFLIFMMMLVIFISAFGKRDKS